MSLYTAETRRLGKRRFTKFLLGGVVLVLIAIAVGMFFANEKNTPATVAAAQAKADSEYQAAVRQSAQDKQTCVAAQGTPDASNWPPSCDDVYQPQTSDFQAAWYMPATFDFREQFPNMITAMAAIVAVAAFVIGASFVGAEWASGGMMNLLLWRPRRLQVLGTKLGALLVALTGLTVLLSAAWTGAFALIAGLRGSLDSMTSGAWQSILLMELRGLAVVLAAGAIGFGLASIGRHTAVAMGVAVGVVVLLQFGLYIVLSMANVGFAEVVLATTWGTAWMNKTATVTDWNSCNFSGNGGCTPDELIVNWPAAGGGLAALLVVVVGIALWTIRSRDIT
ncbi:ABC transporter permease subunit [Winogradskya humida]|uniref:ABC-type transport system involved in multi-copper enzyme maturation permease subunit n=1 Tax=Winogradskya humida TaxID=113566 RepID=A0ABQ3ZQN1_9ACTN|nr:ABC transporter permease subunit [Actinoplanes humidus]GIE20882.1 hypothetical protein Ahu01nite_039840 [Actinoplanes humidus]